MKSQNQTVLAHLRRAGSITQREALLDHSIQCLTKRIQELRNMGYRIVTRVRNHPLTNQRYARYELLERTHKVA
jgi:biotin operon repressor